MSTVAIIQARMQSSRFPGKHLAPLAGMPMINHVVRAVERAELPFVIAMSDEDSDEPLYNHVLRSHWRSFDGSLNDPLDRTYLAAKQASADVVVRITGDCPLIDWRTIRTLVRMFHDGKMDYIGETNSPDGNDCEVFSIDALEKARFHANRTEQEHTTTWIRRYLSCQSLEGAPEFNDVHYSVNTVDDLRLCEEILRQCGDGAHVQDIVAAYRKIKAA